MPVEMKSTRCGVLLFVGILVLHFLAPVTAPGAPRAGHVFIISFDQGNPDLIRKTAMPVFHEMATGGARTWNAFSIVPSTTLPAHASMLTGVGPQAHQMLWNEYLPLREALKVPTIFDLAKKRGMVTAMVVAKEKFKHLAPPGTVDLFIWPSATNNAGTIAKAFSNEVVKLKPNLCFIHFADPDTLGHAFGINSPEKIQALVDCDAALKTIKDAIAAAGILDDSVIILTADHGAHDTRNRSGKTVGTHGSAEAADVTIPWIVWGKGVKNDFLITGTVLQYDTAATVLWLLDIPIPEHFWGRPVTSAFR
jgi:predicted AlkP superfamily pyrophosphatase or phosphodiesterase